MGTKLKLLIYLLLIVVLTGCTDTQVVKEVDYFKDVAANSESRVLGDIILSLYPENLKKDNIPVIADNQTDSELLLTLFKLDSSILDSFALLSSTDNETIAIVAPKAGYEIDVLIGLEHRILSVIDGLTEEQQSNILSNKVVLEQFEDTKYLILVISDNSTLIFEEIKKGLSSWDASKVTVIMTTE